MRIDGLEKEASRITDVRKSNLRKIILNVLIEFWSTPDGLETFFINQEAF